MDPAERIEAVKAVAGEKRAALVRAQGPSCRFCIHGPDNGQAKGICGHIVFQQHKVDVVEDRLQTKALTSTMTARSEDGLCGPEALLFEPYSALRRVWIALKPHFGL